jgi:hypothetical protein
MVYHESIKQNTPTGSSPAHTARTQSNHIFASIYGVKPELARLNHGYNVSPGKRGNSGVEPKVRCMGETGSQNGAKTEEEDTRAGDKL